MRLSAVSRWLRRAHEVRLIEPHPKPGRSETVAVRGAGRQFVGIGAHEEASRHSTLRTDRGLRRTVKMRTAFAAFPPHAFASLQSFRVLRFGVLRSMEVRPLGP